MIVLIYVGFKFLGKENESWVLGTEVPLFLQFIFLLQVGSKVRKLANLKFSCIKKNTSFLLVQFFTFFIQMVIGRFLFFVGFALETD